MQGAVYDTGGCYNDTISRVLPIFVWLTARAALQPFVAVMQTPVTRDQTINSTITPSSPCSTHAQLLKSSLKQYYTIYFYYLFFDMESFNKSKIIRW